MDKEIYVLGINASPRKYGNTYKLLKIAIDTAKYMGAKTEIIHLYDYNIKPCIGCLSDEQLACRYPCVIDDDDGKIILEKILEADGIIIATPIYWYGPSGHLKNLIDRMTVFENMIFVEGRSWVEGKVAGFIAAGADSGNIQVIAYLMSVLNSMGFIIPPWALAYHVGLEDSLSNDAAILDAANVGKVVVDMIKFVKKTHTWYDPELLKKIGHRLIDNIRNEVQILKKEQYRMREPIIKKLMTKQATS